MFTKRTFNSTNKQFTHKRHLFFLYYSAFANLIIVIDENLVRQNTPHCVRINTVCYGATVTVCSFCLHLVSFSRSEDIYEPSTLKTANQCFHMTLWLMMMHRHTKPIFWHDTLAHGAASPHQI